MLVSTYAIYSDRGQVNITEDQNIIYRVEEEEYASITDTGLLKISEDAPIGTEIRIVVEYEGQSKEFIVTVKKK